MAVCELFGRGRIAEVYRLVTLTSINPVYRHFGSERSARLEHIFSGLAGALKAEFHAAVIPITAATVLDPVKSKCEPFYISDKTRGGRAFDLPFAASELVFALYMIYSARISHVPGLRCCQHREAFLLTF
jgi:hypothetical protein